MLDVTELIELRTLLASRRETLGVRLLSRVDSGRLTRATTVPVHEIQFAPDGRAVVARTGAGHYITRILFVPKPAHHCSCPDWQQRRVACKHVVALGLAAADQLDALTTATTSEIDRLTAAAERLSRVAHASSVELKERLGRKRVFPATLKTVPGAEFSRAESPRFPAEHTSV